jgi:hypothetical protein
MSKQAETDHPTLDSQSRGLCERSHHCATTLAPGRTGLTAELVKNGYARAACKRWDLLQ